MSLYINMVPQRVWRFGATVQLCRCVFDKAWPTDPIGSSQEPRLHATIAILGSVSSAQLLFRVYLISWEKDYVGCMTSYMIPGSIKEEDVTTYQERPGSYLKKMSRKLLEEDVATYQERLGSYLKKLLRRIKCIKSVLEIT